MISHILQLDEQREMSDWFTSLFPKIRPAFIADDGCWIASMMTRSSDHNPPWAWIGWAFDSVSEKGGFSRLQQRMIEIHGEKSCRGQDVLDEAARQLVTEACATAWSLRRFGSNSLPLAIGASFENNTSGNWIVSNNGDMDFAINVVRLRPPNTQRETLQQIIEAVNVTKLTEPGGITHIYLYADIWHDGPGYAHGIGYDFEMTQPIIDHLSDYAGEHGIGYVLTKPFQWGNPVAEWL